MSREYKTLKALRAGETIDFEGVPVRMAEGNLQPGDTYIAERNTGPHLLTVKRIQMAVVFPKEQAYCFDHWECVKVTFEE